MINYVSEPNHIAKGYCSLPYTKLLINAKGSVSMCCHQLKQIGQLDEDTDIMEIWNGPLAKEIRSAVSDQKIHPVCSSWNTCPFLVKEKIEMDIPVHKNFAYPTYLEICLPDSHCNIGGLKPTKDNPACIMCKRNFDVPDVPDRTKLFCQKTRKLMPYLRQLMILGTAEPFWKDVVFDVMDDLGFDNHNHHITFITNTNGLCVPQRVREKFFRKVLLSDISFSLDAATPDVYQKIRRLDQFDLVIDNLKSWIKMRSDFGGKYKHRVVIYNNINLLNVHEMPDMVRMAKDLGVDELFMLPTHDHSGNVALGEILLGPKNLNVFKKFSEEAAALAEQIDLKLTYTARFDIVPPSPSELVNIQL